MLPGAYRGQWVNGNGSRFSHSLRDREETINRASEGLGGQSRTLEKATESTRS